MEPRTGYLNVAPSRIPGKQSVLCWLCCGIILGCPLLTPNANASDEVERLETQLKALEERLEKLENPQPVASPPRQLTQEPVIATPSPTESLANAAPGTEVSTAPAEESAADDITIGGALRFNILYRDHVDASQTKRGESGLDVFRFNINGEMDKLIISAEYRYYAYMQTIHHGWIGYEFDDESQLQLGIHQVPFGLAPYASHNSWLGVPYYVGLGDDYDMGVKYVRSDGPWKTHLAFYKNEELNDASDLGRYGFDLVRVNEQQNEEINRGNARVSYMIGAGTDCEHEVGASAQLAELYNARSDRRGDHWAAAVHLDSRCGRWNFQLEGARYRYDPPGDPSLEDNAQVVHVGAFEGSYDIADTANLIVANLAHNFNSPWQRIDQLVCYNDYSRLIKDANGFRDSQVNTLGCAVGSGPLFAYVDYILANNMALFGNGSMAGGGEDEWRSRLNINIGYYW